MVITITGTVNLGLDYEFATVSCAVTAGNIVTTVL